MLVSYRVTRPVWDLSILAFDLMTLKLIADDCGSFARTFLGCRYPFVWMSRCMRMFQWHAKDSRWCNGLVITEVNVHVVRVCATFSQTCNLSILPCSFTMLLKKRGKKIKQKSRATKSVLLEKVIKWLRYGQLFHNG